MLQNLLADRFHLALHHVTRGLQGYELIKGRSEPKLKSSHEDPSDASQPETPPKVDANGFPQLDHSGMAMMEGVKGKAVVVHLTARPQPLSALTDRLSREFRLPVADRTGLVGTFDFTLEFAPQAPGALPSAAAAEGLPSLDESAPNLLEAVRQQLGLRLNPSKVPTDVLIIDRVDQTPTEN